MSAVLLLGAGIAKVVQNRAKKDQDDAETGSQDPGGMEPA